MQQTPRLVEFGLVVPIAEPASLEPIEQIDELIADFENVLAG